MGKPDNPAKGFGINGLSAVGLFFSSISGDFDQKTISPGNQSLLSDAFDIFPATNHVARVSQDRHDCLALDDLDVSGIGLIPKNIMPTNTAQTGDDRAAQTGD